MPRKSPAPEPSAGELDELIQSAGPAEIPENLGNIPGEQPPKPELEAQQEPLPPEPEPEPQPEESEWDRRLAALERENQFLRMAVQQPQPPQSQPVQQEPQDWTKTIDTLLGGFKVSPEDVQVILSDPARGAEYLHNGIRTAIGAGAALALQQARQEFQTYLTQAQAAQSQQTQAQQLQQAFYSQHSDLQPYSSVVLAKAQEVYQERQGRIDAQTLIDETAGRTKAQLKAWGVKLPNQPRGVSRLRPAQAEGTGGGGRTDRGISALERDIYQLHNAR